MGVGSMSSESDSLLVVEQSFFVLRLKSAEEQSTYYSPLMGIGSADTSR